MARAASRALRALCCAVLCLGLSEGAYVRLEEGQAVDSSVLAERGVLLVLDTGPEHPSRVEVQVRSSVSAADSPFGVEWALGQPGFVSVEAGNSTAVVRLGPEPQLRCDFRESVSVRLQGGGEVLFHVRQYDSGAAESAAAATAVLRVVAFVAAFASFAAQSNCDATAGGGCVLASTKLAVLTWSACAEQDADETPDRQVDWLLSPFGMEGSSRAADCLYRVLTHALLAAACLAAHAIVAKTVGNSDWVRAREAWRFPALSLPVLAWAHLGAFQAAASLAAAARGAADAALCAVFVLVLLAPPAAIGRHCTASRLAAHGAVVGGVVAPGSRRPSFWGNPGCWRRKKEAAWVSVGGSALQRWGTVWEGYVEGWARFAAIDVVLTLVPLATLAWQPQTRDGCAARAAVCAAALLSQAALVLYLRPHALPVSDLTAALADGVAGLGLVLLFRAARSGDRNSALFAGANTMLAVALAVVCLRAVAEGVVPFSCGPVPSLNGPSQQATPRGSYYGVMPSALEQTTVSVSTGVPVRPDASLSLTPQVRSLSMSQSPARRLCRHHSAPPTSVYRAGLGWKRKAPPALDLRGLSSLSGTGMTLPGIEARPQVPQIPPLARVATYVGGAGQADVRGRRRSHTAHRQPSRGRVESNPLLTGGAPLRRKASLQVVTPPRLSLAAGRKRSTAEMAAVADVERSCSAAPSDI
eukprot:TRINITY_DN20235_c0_g1_i2.p1 TRINITY_DN20235_c0_g1~~TRINITY_DN20235_c0_g1_i2.p1  ORF type:complete len:699 (+),score=172.47 TRINITY_DN20235_c0_g1_i2:60-2156(+)